GLISMNTRRSASLVPTRLPERSSSGRIAAYGHTCGTALGSGCGGTMASIIVHRGCAPCAAASENRRSRESVAIIWLPWWAGSRSGRGGAVGTRREDPYVQRYPKPAPSCGGAVGRGRSGAPARARGRRRAAVAGGARSGGRDVVGEGASLPRELRAGRAGGPGRAHGRLRRRAARGAGRAGGARAVRRGARRG